MRLLAIGDVHGASAALDALLAAVDLRDGDTLVTLGDYVDKGFDSKGVIDRLIAIDRRDDVALVPILGNHDEMMLNARVGRDRHWRICFGFRTVGSYGREYTPLEPPTPEDVDRDVPEEHWAFLERCRPHYETEQFLFTHANVYPNADLADTPGERLRWSRLNAESSTPHVSGKTLICGHTAQTSGEPLDLGHAICIDTHAWAGGWLTCLEVHSRQWWRANLEGAVETGVL